jgi:hypothetical protein
MTKPKSAQETFALLNRAKVLLKEHVKAKADFHKAMTSLRNYIRKELKFSPHIKVTAKLYDRWPSAVGVSAVGVRFYCEHGNDWTKDDDALINNIVGLVCHELGFELADGGQHHGISRFYVLEARN